MPATAFDVFVFDFDGTLVQSAEAKRQAFFDILGPVHAPAVEAVLAANPDATRFTVIPMVLAEIDRRGLPAPDTDTAALVAAYGEMADTRVAAAPELPGAGALLRRLSEAASVYVASMTPHDQLLAHLDRRGWMRFLAGAFGYPHPKAATVAMLLARHRIAPQRLLVVGDGGSDAEAAAANGCPFHRIGGPSDLLKVADLGVAANV